MNFCHQMRLTERLKNQDMKKPATKSFLCFITLLALMSFACGLSVSQKTTQPVESSPVITASIVMLKPSESPAVRMMETIEPVFTPVSTPEPTLQVISVGDLPVHVGTELPRSAEQISLENAGRLRLVGLWGLGSPQGLLWSQDGSRIVVGYQAGVLVFDVETGSELYRIRTTGWLAGMDISPDGRNLALVHSDGKLEFYNLLDGKLVQSLAEFLSGEPVSLLYLLDGESLLVGLHAGMVAIISTQALEAPVVSIFGDYGYPVNHLAIIPDGQRVLGMGNDQGLAVWNLSDEENPQLSYYLPGSEGVSGLIGMAVSKDSRWVSASSWDGTLLWDVGDESALQYYKMLWGEVEGFNPLNTRSSLAFSVDSQRLAVGSEDGTIWLWDTVEAIPLKAVQAGASRVSYLTYSPDGQTLAAVIEDGQVVLLESDSLFLQKTLPTADNWFGSLAALSGDGQFLATATQAYLGDGSMISLFDAESLYLRSLADGRVIQTMDMQNYEIPTSGFVGLALSSDGEWLAASPLGLPAGVWNTTTGALAYFLIETPEADLICNQVLFSPNDQILAAACQDGHVHLWQVASGKYLRSLQADYLGVSALAFSPDGNLLVTADADGSIKLWNPEHGSLAGSLQVIEPAPITNLSFSHDGNYLVCTTGRDYPKATIWDVTSQEQVQSFGFNDTVSLAAFSPDGTLLAVAVNFEYMDKLEIWDWQGQTLLAALEYQTDINGLYFTPDGRFLITVSQDGLVRIWGVVP